MEGKIDARLQQMSISLNAELCQTTQRPVRLHLQIGDKSQRLVTPEVGHGDVYSEREEQEQTEKYK